MRARGDALGLVQIKVEVEREALVGGRRVAGADHHEAAGAVAQAALGGRGVVPPNASYAVAAKRSPKPTRSRPLWRWPRLGKNASSVVGVPGSSPGAARDRDAGDALAGPEQALLPFQAYDLGVAVIGDVVARGREAGRGRVALLHRGLAVEHHRPVADLVAQAGEASKGLRDEAAVGLRVAGVAAAVDGLLRAIALEELVQLPDAFAGNVHGQAGEVEAVGPGGVQRGCGR